MQQSNKPKNSPILILLMVVTIVLLGIIVFQNFSNARIQAPIATATATVIPSQPISTPDPITSLQTDIDNLKSEVKDIQQGKTTSWLDVLVVSAPNLIWAVLVILFVIIFLDSLKRIVDNLARRVGNSDLELPSGIKISSNAAGNALEEREILRIALKLSNADKGDAEERELNFIGQLADHMDGEKDYLSLENKFKVLSVAIRVALIDAEFTDTEYEEIMILAMNEYNLSGDDINKLHEMMLSQMLIRRHNISNDDGHNAKTAKDVIPPQQLKKRYELAKRSINAPSP